MSPDYDVFVSYSPEDADWVHAFVRRLRDEGLRAAYDAIALAPDGEVAHSLEQAIRSTADGVVVISGASRENAWVHEEYRALMQGVLGGGHRFVPVLIGGADPPPFAAGPASLDFRTGDYDDLVTGLVRVLRR